MPPPPPPATVPETPPPPPSAEALLQQARALADAEQAEPALALAQAALKQAEAEGDARACAEAWLCSASCELRLRGHFAAALQHGQRAVQAFQAARDVPGECRALATQAIAASRLAYHEMAVDSALLAVRLADAPGTATREQVMAFHALGVAMFSGKCFVEAANAYQQAIARAQRCVPPLNAFELHSDLAATESYRYISERGAGGQRLSLDMLETHLRHCDTLLAQSAAPGSIAMGSHGNNRLILGLTRALLLAWRLRLDEATAELAQVRALQGQLHRPWLGAAVAWVQTELALAGGDLAAARTEAQTMLAVAQAHQHEGLLALGCQVLAHVCERQGDTAAALAAMRLLAQREQHARAQSLKGRLDVIEGQLVMRQQQQQLQRLESDTRLYQRLAMEDGLTGLANRRHFEARLHAALQGAFPGACDGGSGGGTGGGSGPSGPAPCLAMIDVDRFKQINDQHSHNVGDEVLRTLATLLRAHTRDQDLPARLAGDEFVILLGEADLAQAALVCERLRAAVQQHPWAALSPGLCVSVSIGLARAEPGDTPQALLGRSDARMYADKRR